MIKFLLWLILFVICWPVAILALIAYPLYAPRVFELDRPERAQPLYNQMTHRPCNGAVFLCLLAVTLRRSG